MALVSVPSGANSESANSSAWSPVYGGGAKLDSDTINYIHRIYCRECRMEEQRRKMEQEAAASGSGSTNKPTSPQNVVEEASLQQAMDKNKESLKRKLMLRRSVVELAEQGIYPPLKTPPAFNEERKKLELARNRDLLRQKIQQRPNRESLVQQHILEDSTADRSIQERQRQLKRARLQDSLSDRLAHRPGPLELVEGNILQIDPNFKDAINDGTLQYFRASEDEDDTFVFDSNGSPSDTGSMSPQQAEGSETYSAVVIRPKGSIPSPPDISPLVQKLTQKSTFGQSIPPITTKSFVPTPSSSLVSNGSSLAKNGQSQSSVNSKLSKIKKPKPKSVPKAKVIKFHEYKGPPNLVKLQPPATSPTPVQNPQADGTPYNILLQQQQLFLQWQLEFQQKNLQLILPAGQKEGQSTPSTSQPSQTSSGAQNSTFAQAPPHLSAPSPAPSLDSISGNNNFINPPSVSPAPSLSAASSVSSVPSPLGSFQLQSVMSPPMAVLSPPPPPPMPPKIPTPVPQQPIQVTSPPPVAPTPLVVQPARQTSTPAPVQTTKMPNFDEMKVADLKAELRRRTLTVSGTKIQLVERLKNAIEKDNANAINANASAVTTSTSTVTTSLPSLSEPLKSPRSVQSVASIGSIHSIPPFIPQNITPHFLPSQQEEVVMTTGSPPISPTNSATDLNVSFTTPGGPVSPENIMDTSSQGPLFSIIVNQTAAHQLQNGNIPMSIDPISRPPSAVPMDIDSASMTAVQSATDQNQNQPAPFITVPLSTLQKCQVTTAKMSVSNSVYKPGVPTNSNGKFQQKSPVKVTQSRKSTSKMKTSASAPQLQGTDPKWEGILSRLIPLDNAVRIQNQEPQTKPTTKVAQPPVQTNPVMPPMQVLTSPGPAFTTEALLQQQQQQIDELKRQLLQSQQKLQQAERAQVTPKTQTKSKGSGTSKKKSSGKGKSSSNTNLNSNVKTNQNSNSTNSKPQVLATIKVPLPQSVVSASSTGLATTTATVTQASTPSKDVKAVLSNFLQSHGLHNINIGQPKVLAVSSGTGAQPIIIMPRNVSSADNKVVVTSVAALNGVSAPSTRASSVPTSPVNQNHALHRSATNPFFKANVKNKPPLKEPPKYDEAIKNKQNLLLQQQKNGTEPVSAAPVVSSIVMPMKSQAMDDVLEILIRTGELPATAAQDPPPTPKTIQQTTNPRTITVQSNTFTIPAVPSSIPSSKTVPNISIPVLLATTAVLTTNTTSKTNTVTTQSIQVPQTALVHSTCAPSIPKKEPASPLSIISGISSAVSTDDTVNTGLELGNGLDFNIMDMEWTESDASLGGLDLPDGLDTPNIPDLPNNVPKVKLEDVKSNDISSSHMMAQPEFTPLDLGDIDMTDTNNAMNLDWLDVIMPNTSLPTPLSSNSTVSFPGDPILTPKPQEFLDLFNMEESDLITPTELKTEPMFETIDIETSKS